MKFFRIMLSSRLFTAFFTLFLLFVFEAECAKHLKIGAIFDEESYESQMAFKYAIDRVNMHSPKIKFDPVIKIVSGADSFQTGKAVCNLTSLGVIGIFGPESLESRGIVQSICATFEIPHIETTWIPDPPEPEINNDMTLNVYPDTQMLSYAYAALVEDYDWVTYTILYEEDEGLIRLEEILKRHGPDNAPITVRQLNPNDDNRPIFKTLQHSGEKRLILDCKPENILIYLRQASDVKLAGDYQSFILTNPDAHTIDMQEFKFGRSNITSMRMVNPQSSEFLNAIHDWEEGERMKPRSEQFQVNPDSVPLKAALMNDAVKHFASSVITLDKTENIQAESIECDQEANFKSGLAIANYLKIRQSVGLTGEVKFVEGKRTEFSLDILELKSTGYDKIGFFNPEMEYPIQSTRSEEDKMQAVSQKWQNKTLIVSSRLGPPYLMRKKAEVGQVLEGNERYEGYSMDLIDGISKILNFTYEFKLAPDNGYGSYDKKAKRWNGLIGELLEGRADLAICDLTITSERKSVVDFTMPFMTLGISILYSKPEKQPPDLFSFLSPLSMDVWIYMGTAYLGVSLLLFILARISPTSWESERPGDEDPKELVNVWELRNTFWFSMGSLMGAGCDILPKMAPEEWANPHPCDSEPEELENALTLLNSMWLSMGSFLQQGSDILPKAVSTRMVAGMWWFFTLIMISSYTANLAAFLTNERMDATIENAEDLAKQNKIKYGAVIGGSTANFFKNSNFSTYKRMWANMESTRPSVFVSNNNDGVDRVLKGKRLYAFIMESTQIEYELERNCTLTQIGGKLDSKGYGIAMPTNSYLRTPISGAVLKMQEEGKLHALKTKWWKEMHGGGECKADDSDKDAASAAELGLDNVGGVFVVLGCGCGIACIIAVLEFLWNVRKVAVEEKVLFKDALRAEMKFALNVWITTKPVKNAISESQSSHTSRSGSQDRDPSEAKNKPENLLQAASSFMRLDKVF